MEGYSNDQILLSDYIKCSLIVMNLRIMSDNKTLSKHCRAGLRGRELIGLVGKSMLQGGGTFGVFMSVGTAIRC